MFKKIINMYKNIYANHFEIASFLSASAIILLAILLDNLLNLRACPLCILTRYIFGAIAVVSLIGFFIKKFYVLNKLLIILASIYGIAVSGGSACQSGSGKGSHVLSEILNQDDMNKPSIRFSFSIYNTKKELDLVVLILKDLVKDTNS